MPVVKMKISMAAATYSYVPGDLVMVTDAVAAEWIQIGHAEAYEEKPVKVSDLDQDNDDADPIPGLKLVSRGLYELPNGEQVQGKKEAEKTYQAYLSEQNQPDSGNANADQTGNQPDGGNANADQTGNQPEGGDANADQSGNG